MTEKPKDARTVTLKRVRLSFTDALVEARAKSEDNPDKKTHHLNIINEASSPTFAENNAKIMAAIRAACDKQWKDPERFKQIAEDAPKRICFRDGSKWKNKEGKVYAGYEGNKGLSTSGPDGGKKRPKLLDRLKHLCVLAGQVVPANWKGQVRHITLGDIGEVFYGGSYADVIVSFYGTEKGSPGVFSTCELIRSYQEGEAMAGGYHLDESDVDDLDDFDDDGMDGPGAAGGGDLTDLL
jgi:hypothetical protein